MKILLNNNDLNKALTSVSNLGFVPTMGALHKGHISLIKNSKKKSNTGPSFPEALLINAIVELDLKIFMIRRTFCQDQNI